MTDISFLTTLLTFPTVVFTILLGIILVYWLFVLLGALDIDVFGNVLEGESFNEFLTAAGLHEVPITIVISLLILCAWAITALGTYYWVLPLSMPLWQFIVGLVVLLVGFLVAWFITAQLIKPLRKIFTTHEIYAQDKLVGKMCVISTLRVDEQFGQASYDDNGAGLILIVRASTPNNLTKGSKALIVSYDKEENIYIVTSYDEVLDPSINWVK